MDTKTAAACVLLACAAILPIPARACGEDHGGARAATLRPGQALAFNHGGRTLVIHLAPAGKGFTVVATAADDADGAHALRTTHRLADGQSVLVHVPGAGGVLASRVGDALSLREVDLPRPGL